ncbi:Maf family protein [Halopseudomonas phragmitis]|uniref:7-methyl-GTP pyrophosphatase n=1 Tax=Halopseudomonas phragmitis TaxID=1931241 RepID=A0A1V0B6S8_9GAMM|nr:Maf family nucleotide pyrophosphatase [Halopseudomonas phragmitis]AQZ95628.1 septum formation inhibitor Maf [Halopseudomonas phragmitis]
MPSLVLASSSPYRRQLLERLNLPFEWAAPDIDETPLPGEAPEQLTLRLAEAKARALIEHYPTHLIIGSDQVLLLDGQPVSKPGNHANALEQLRRCSGKSIRFLTSLCLLDSASDTARSIVEPFEVVFRQLDEATIERYLLAEQPYDCAGSFKSEGLGISLFRALRGDDPNSLIGLPLIRLCDLLAEHGIQIP